MLTGNHTQAINHAVNIEEWGVDIVAIPSGFKDYHPGIFDAISNANDAKNKKPVLIFAAPANWGNRDEVAFPARLYWMHKVISMFSTTSQNKPTPSFNPAPIQTARHNLAIFGEQVVIPTEEPLDGTSVSTMIGAGLAGRILSFAHQPDNAGRIPSLSRLRRVEGMSRVFKFMSVPENGYDCVWPERLLPRDVQKSDAGRVVARVCEAIRTELENLY